MILQTPALRRARMIKNAQLNSVVEMFGDRHTGSGQLEVTAVRRYFNLPETPPHPDVQLLLKLAQLPSFDVYSLRMAFRENNIPISSVSALNLSPSKVKELTAHMTKFTRPLIREVYQTEDLKADSLDGILDLFRNPDPKKVQHRLRVMADKLKIRISEIPKFLEDYGDIFLSLLYYRKCLDDIVPTIGDFVASMRGFRSNRQLLDDAQLMKTCAYIETTIDRLVAWITEWFDDFDEGANAIWADLSAETFRDLEQVIRGYHTTIGGIICGLSVKMLAWSKQFPNENSGGLLRRAEFVMTDMRIGLDRLQKIEAAAPKLRIA